MRAFILTLLCAVVTHVGCSQDRPIRIGGTIRVDTLLIGNANVKDSLASLRTEANKRKDTTAALRASITTLGLNDTTLSGRLRDSLSAMRALLRDSSGVLRALADRNLDTAFARDAAIRSSVADSANAITGRVTTVRDSTKKAYDTLAVHRTALARNQDSLSAHLARLGAINDTLRAHKTADSTALANLTTQMSSVLTQIAALQGQVDSGYDVTPPATIASLVVDSTNTTTAHLRWTAPGDNGSTGTASGYVVKYSTRYFTDGDLIQNRTFESDVAYWQLNGQATFVWSTARAHSGSGSARLTMQQEELYPWVGYNLVTSAADTLRFSFWAYADEDVTIDPLVLNQAYTIIGGSSPVSLTAGVWTQVSRTVVLPGTQTIVRVGFNPDPGLDGASIWIDDASCQIGVDWTEATTALNAPTPVVAGGTQTMILTGLPDGASFYAAVKAYDDRYNYSGMSNTVSFTTVLSGGGGEGESEGAPVVYTFHKYASPTGSRSNPGTYALPWDLATVNDSIGSRYGLDSVGLLAGVYTQSIAPTYSGKADSPLVIMNYGAALCSLYTTNSAIDLDGVDYVHVTGIRARTAPTCGYPVAKFLDAHHNKLSFVRMYGGSTFNNPALYGTANSVELDSSNYNRIFRCYLNRLDTAITADENRGEGYFVGHASHYNILEQDTAEHVSHFAFVVPRGPATNQAEVSMRHWTHNVVRNCVARYNHVGFGSTDYADQVLFEGNVAYANGRSNTYRDGLSFEGTSRNGRYRWNIFFQDSIPVWSGNIGWTNTISTQSWGGVNWNNRYLGNGFFAGAYEPMAERHAFGIFNDTEDQDSIGLDKFKNNMFVQLGPYGFPLTWEDLAAGKPDSMWYNLFWGHEPADTIGSSDPGGIRFLADIEGGTTRGVFFDESNIEASPLFADSLSRGPDRSFELSSGSPARNAGGALTVVTSNVSSSTVVPVDDPWWFHYNAGASPYERGDSVLIGTVRAEIDSVDGIGKKLITVEAVTVTAASEVHILRTWSAVAGAYVRRLYGSAPDIGPKEYQE